MFEKRRWFSALSMVAAVGLVVLAVWGTGVVLHADAMRADVEPASLSVALEGYRDALYLLLGAALLFATATVGLLVFVRAVVLPETEQSLIALERELRASDQLASIGRLASGVAHEINNPMTYVTTNLQLLGEELHEREVVASVDVEPLVEAALGGAMRVSAIVRAMDAFQTATDADGDSDLNAAIDEALARFPELPNVAEVRRSTAEGLRVPGEQGWMVEVLSRILDNARRAIGTSQPGVVRIETTTCTDGTVEVAISDNGPGLPDSIRRNACDPFVTTRDVGEGAGLGLFVCQGIVASLGGSIALQSESGEGTTVRIKLPLKFDP